MAQSLSAAVFSFPHRPPARRHGPAIPAKTSVPKLRSSRRSFVLVGGMPPSGAGTGKPNGVDGGTPGTDPGITARGNLPGFPLPSIPVWARWFLGFVFGVAIPLYGRFRSIEQGVEKAAEGNAICTAGRANNLHGRPRHPAPRARAHPRMWVRPRPCGRRMARRPCKLPTVHKAVLPKNIVDRAMLGARLACPSLGAAWMHQLGARTLNIFLVDMVLPYLCIRPLGFDPMD
ncbi:hypothetical protein Taro_048779 [Colocasia esculenta]|uniref:Uncharacterized protein n=1 Tax=Colocasia esculenta TaxID=4460 RepID=A0A843X947_COLES|nr:hypothetical protein [Colocasia esculenta]